MLWELSELEFFIFTLCRCPPTLSGRKGGKGGGEVGKGEECLGEEWMADDVMFQMTWVKLFPRERYYIRRECN